MRRIAAGLVVAAVGLAGLGVVQSLPVRHSIEDKLTDRSSRALTQAGLSDVEVSFVGRDATVRVRSAADGERAAAVVRAQVGVRVARVQVIARPVEPVPPTVAFALAGGRVTITGTVPSDSARLALVGAVAAVFGASSVDDRLALDPSVTDTGLTGLGAVVAALGKDASAQVELRGGVITLGGLVPTAAAREAAVRAAAQVVGSPTAVVDRLGVSAAPAPPQVQSRLVALPPITFEPGSATLTAPGRAVAAEAAAILAANPAVRVRIEGHTDTDGPAAANLALSQARAQAVLAALVAAGIAPGRLTAAGFGETRPKVPDTTAENQATNRRVDFVVLP